MPIHKMSFPQGKLHRLSWQCVIGRTDFKNKYENRKHYKKSTFFLGSESYRMVKRMESLKGLCGKIWPREVPRVIKLSQGAQPQGKV